MPALREQKRAAILLGLRAIAPGLVALMLPLTNTRPIILSVLAAAIVAWVAQPLPLRLGLLAAVVVGIIVGMWAEAQQSPRGALR